MPRFFWWRKGAATSMPAPPPGYYKQALNWMKRVRQPQHQTRKDNMEPVNGDQFCLQETNWDAVKVAALSVTCSVLLLILVTPWLRRYLRLVKKAKRKTSVGQKTVYCDEAEKIITESNDSTLGVNLESFEGKRHRYPQNMGNQLRKKKLSISNQEMADLSSFEIDSAVLEVKERVGLGSFADVHSGMFRGTPVAVKILRNSDRESLIRFKQELLLMKSLRHPNIVQLYGPCWNSGKFMIVTELFTYGNLADVLSNPDLDLTWPKEKYYMICDIARGMAYLHGVKYYDYSTKTYKDCIVHRDLKPQNLLVTEGLHIKISDFGEARALDTDYTMTQVGTLLYIAPEIVRGKKYGEKCDVYSFGVVLFAMLIKKSQCVFQVFAEELERRKNMGHEEVMPTSPPLLENGPTMSPAESDDGENRQAAISKLRRKHTPHVVTEAIVNDHLRPKLPKGALLSLSLLTRQAWDPDPSKRPSFTVILSYIESVVKDEVMYGVRITEDDFVDSSSYSPCSDTPLEIGSKDNYAGSHNIDPKEATDSVSPLLSTSEMRSSQVEHVPSLVNNGNSDLLIRIERMKMRSRGIYAPVRDNLSASFFDLEDLHNSTQQQHGTDSTSSDVSVKNVYYPEKQDVHGPFAVPSAAACRRHRRKSYDKPS